jgi:serpin B
MAKQLAWIIAAAVSLLCTSSVRGQQRDSMAAAVNRFGLELYSRLNDEKSNLLISPFSVATSLAFTYSGTRQATREQMAAILRFDGNAERFNREFRRYYSAVLSSGSRSLQLSVRNICLWDASLPVSTGFQGTAGKVFQYQAKAADFRKAGWEAEQEINIAAEKQSHLTVTEPLSQETALDSVDMVHASTLYFYANWQKQFDREQTRSGLFYISEGRSVSVDFMSQNGEFGFFENDNIRAIEIPYTGSSVSMIIIWSKNLKKIDEELRFAGYSAWEGRLVKQRMDISIPRFRVRTGINLQQPLREMGIIALFSRSADLGGMFPGESHVDRLQAEAFVEIDEKGTEAAASTIQYIQKGTSEEDTKNFKVDHPFVFLIRDTITGTILFIGRIVNPVK